MTFNDRINKAIEAGLVHADIDRAKAKRLFNAISYSPRDLEGLPEVQAGVAIAQADIGTDSAGWIPEVQRVGCEIADLK